MERIMSEPMKEKIFEAIEKARGEGFSELKKSGKNPAFSSKYSTLMDVFDSCKKPLEENGIHISFTTEVVNMNDRIENLLVCTLYHLPSGEKLESKISCLDDTKKGSQAIGSGITYMRRYLLQSMLNLECDPETDDDGNSTTVEPKSTMVQNGTTPPPGSKQEEIKTVVKELSGKNNQVKKNEGETHPQAVFRILKHFMQDQGSVNHLKEFISVNQEAINTFKDDKDLMAKFKQETKTKLDNLQGAN